MKCTTCRNIWRWVVSQSRRLSIATYLLQNLTWVFKYRKRTGATIAKNIKQQIKTMRFRTINNNELITKYKKHLASKLAMRADHKKHKEANTPILLFDLQNVITLPRAEVISLFYYRKLNMYNLTALQKKYIALFGRKQWPAGVEMT